MTTLYLILMLLSALCFAGAATGRVALNGRDNRPFLLLLPLGLFFAVLPTLIQYARIVF